MANKSRSQIALHTLKLALNIDAITDALLGTLKERRRVYPAQEAAVQALLYYFDSRLFKSLHVLTVPMIVALGFSEKTSRNAIIKLRSAGILMLVTRGQWDPTKNTMSPNVYELNSAMVQKLVPHTKGDALEAIIASGGTYDQYLRAEAACSIVEDRITGEMVVREYDRQNNRISKKLQGSALFGRGAL